MAISNCFYFLFYLSLFVFLNICNSEITIHNEIDNIQDKLDHILIHINTISTITEQEWLNSLIELDNSLYQVQNVTITWNQAEQLTVTSIEIINILLSKQTIMEVLDDDNKMYSISSLYSIAQQMCSIMNSQMQQHQNQSSWMFDQMVNIQIITKLFDRDVEFVSDDIQIEFKLSLPISESVNKTAASLVTMTNISKIFTFNPNLQVNSQSVSLFIDLNQTNLASTSLTHSTKNVKTLHQNAEPLCAYWDFDNWSTVGCRPVLELSNSTYTTCECDHLSNFVTLRNITGNDSTIDDVLTGIDDLLESTSSPDLSLQQWSDSLSTINDLISEMLNEQTLAQIDYSTAFDITNSSLKVLNNLVENSVWINQQATMNHSVTVTFASEIFNLVSELSIVMNTKQAGNDTTGSIVHSSIQMQSKYVTINLRNNNVINFEFENVTFELPWANFDKSIATSVAVLGNISRQLSFGQMLVNSQIVSIKIEDSKSVDLNQSFRLITKNYERLFFGDQPACQYWNMDKSIWSSAGCSYNQTDSNRTHTICECSHLSDFAALVDINNREVPSLAKSILTYICSGVTCVFLALALYISLKHNKENYLLYNDQFKMKSNKFALNLNIFVWLFVSHLVIMFGMNLPDYPGFDNSRAFHISCEVVSVFLLFCLLTTFSFMFMLGIHLYMSTSHNYAFKFVNFRRFALFGYIFPVVIIVVSIVLIYILEFSDGQLKWRLDFLEGTFDSLASEYFCWISSKKYPYHIWMFLGPMTALVLLNAIILYNALFNIMCSKHSSPKKVPGHHRLRVNLLASYILLFNLGIPWLLYIFYLNEQIQKYFSYIFIVVNGTQGIVMFLEQFYLHRVKQKKSRSNQQQISDSTKSTYVTSND